MDFKSKTIAEYAAEAASEHPDAYDLLRRYFLPCNHLEYLSLGEFLKRLEIIHEDAWEMVNRPATSEERAEEVGEIVDAHEEFLGAS